MKKAPSVGSHQYRLQDKSEWIVIKGCYEAIVSEDEYEKAQKVIRTKDRKAAKQRKETEVQKILKDLSDIMAKEEHNKASKLRRYEEYAAGVLSKEAYLKEKQNADVKEKVLREEKVAKEEAMSLLEHNTNVQDIEETVLERYRTQDGLTNDMAKAFVEAVYIKPDSVVEIKWRYKDNLDKTIKNDKMEVDK